MKIPCNVSRSCSVFFMLSFMPFFLDSAAGQLPNPSQNAKMFCHGGGIGKLTAYTTLAATRDKGSETSNTLAHATREHKHVDFYDSSELVMNKLTFWIADELITHTPVSISLEPADVQSMLIALDSFCRNQGFPIVNINKNLKSDCQNVMITHYKNVTLELTADAYHYKKQI